MRSSAVPEDPVHNWKYMAAVWANAVLKIDANTSATDARMLSSPEGRFSAAINLPLGACGYKPPRPDVVP
jgi:hypothetical protein